MRAISGGEVDAFVVEREQGDEVEMLSAAHRPYRLMVEKMQQGAVTLSTRGEILYTNQPFVDDGRPILDRFDRHAARAARCGADRALLAAFLDGAQGTAAQGELTLLHASGALRARTLRGRVAARRRRRLSDRHGPDRAESLRGDRRGAGTRTLDSRSSD